MLDTLRKKAGSWIAKVLIGLLAISFAVWGIADVFTGFGNDSVAKVGKTEISTLQFQEAYQRELSALSNQLNQQITAEQGAAFGIPGQVLGRLIAEAAVNDEATSLKLGVSDDAILEVIQKDPSFQGIGGTFDRNRLNNFLRAVQISSDEFVVLQQKLAERQQLVEALAGDVAAPKPLVQLAYQYQNEERVIQFVSLPETLVGTVTPPTEEELNSYFEENKANYRAPEFRKATFIELTPASVALPQSVTDEQIKAEYERQKPRLQTKEQRQVFQLSFANESQAEEAAQQLQSGASFENIMSERDLTESDVDLGLMTKSGFLDQSIADAAFALAEGETSGVINGKLSNVIIKVNKIEPATTSSLQQEEPRLRKEIAESIAEDEIQNLYEEIEDARAGGSTFQEIASRFKLNLETSAPFNRSGIGQEGNKVEVPSAENFISDVFGSDIGQENDAIALGTNGYLWYQVDQVIPERDKSLSEVNELVKTDWTDDKRSKLLDEEAKSLLQKLENGTPLFEIAHETGLTVETSEPFSRNSVPSSLSREAVSAAFSEPVGSTAEVIGRPDERLLIKVISSNTPVTNEQQMQQLEQEMANDVQNTLVNQYVQRLETDANVQVNQNLLSQVSRSAAR
ncbi:SurA N-terminal domain-containing protein [Flexibacterium corallicola]|uniref:SurA N-terminal domain-containing protein n=1 Tax=Flexibacterium corallicola TaxID=3037259 RepID=UPI00286F35DC|nr:SurA N-terminal domain-containing protein [Pseudovibrio sp. M1P-2-3]